MEGTPFAVENNADDDKESRRKEEEREPSALERVIAAISQPAPEIEKKLAAEEEPVVLPETEPPVERVPEEDARRIMHEMVSVEQPVETEQEEAPDPEPEAEPAPEAETEPAEAPEIEPPTPEAEPDPPAETEPEVVQAEAPPAPTPEETPAIQVMPETAPEPPAETEPEPEAEAEPEPPAEAPAEKLETPADEDDKKPGFFGSLFKRRGRNKTKEEPETEESVEKEPEEPAPVVEKDEPEGPEFRFTEKTEDSAERPETVEAPEEPETPREPEAKPERIGQMLLHVEDVAAERPSQSIAEATVSSQAAEERMKVESSPIEPASGKRIDTLSRAELMELGETIEINGSNLRHIYETHLIGEHGLRRLVAEYVQGGDLPRALRREVLAHEMDFERDPVMRNLAPPAAAPVTSNHTALEKLLKEADVTMAGQGEQTAFSKTGTKYETAGTRQRQPRQYRVLDIALVATISILTLLVILVLLARG